MKYLSVISLMVLAAATLSSCGPDDDAPVQSVNTQSSRPTTWTVTSNTTFSSMLIIMDQSSVPYDMDSLDLAATFVDDECRGVASPFINPEGNWQVNLEAAMTTADDDRSSLDIQIRYYSAKAKKCITSENIPLNASTILGTNTSGYQPTWKGLSE